MLSASSCQILHGSPGGELLSSSDINAREELPPLDDHDDSQDSVVLQGGKSTSTSNQVQTMIDSYKEQPEPRLINHRAQQYLHHNEPSANTKTSQPGMMMHKRSQDRLLYHQNQHHTTTQQSEIKAIHNNPAVSERQMTTAAAGAKSNSGASSNVTMGNFVDQNVARTSHDK